MAFSKRAINLISIIFISLAAMSPTLLKADVAGDWCGRTSRSYLCLSIVNSDRRADLKTGPNGIATILRDKAVATAVAASQKIAPLLRGATDKRTTDSLRTCSTDYFDTINTLTTADLRTISRQTYPELARVIKTGNDKAIECEGSFQARPAISSPVTAENEQLKQICATTLEVISLVVCNKPSSC